MRATPVVARLAQVRRRVEMAFQMLREPSPEVLKGCQALLGAALVELEESRPAWSEARGDRQAIAEAARVRMAVDQTGRLLETAARFHAQWYRLLATRKAGYTCRGAPAELSSQGRIWLQG